MLDFLSLLIINVAVLFLMYFVLKRRIDRAVQAEKILENVRMEVQRMIVEINRTTDGSIAMIEDRMKSLDDLLSRTDKRIGILKREIDKHEVSTQVYSSIIKKNTVQPEEAPPQGAQVKRSVREEVLELHRKGFGKDLIAQKLRLTIGEVDLIISLNPGQQQ